MTVMLFKLVYTISHHGNKSTQNTHMVCISVALPRRNDPILELFDVGHSGGEELLKRWYLPSQLTIRGSSTSLPANNFFSGGRPTFSKAQKTPKKQTDAKQSEVLFTPRWESLPPIVTIFRLISSGPAWSIVKLAIVTACWIYFKMRWRSPFCCFFCSRGARAQ